MAGKERDLTPKLAILFFEEHGIFCNYFFRLRRADVKKKVVPENFMRL